MKQARPSSGFAAGTYFLQMTKAPEGYTLLAKNIRVNVRADGTIVFPNRPPTPQATFDDNGQGKYTVIITGTEAAKLPFAGGQGIPVAVIGALVTAAVVAAALWWRRRWRTHKASTNDAS